LKVLVALPTMQLVDHHACTHGNKTKRQQQPEWTTAGARDIHVHPDERLTVLKLRE
jgi:hypothetical protein